MSKRSERREAERVARKLAFKQLRQQRSSAQEIPAEAIAPASQEPAPKPVSGIVQPAPVSTISEARLSANRANARLSTGPLTAAGKARSSQNALKHGLTSQAVLLPHEDADLYQRVLETYFDTHQPATPEEAALVQSLHDCAWRISRVQRVEAGILLKGHLEFSAKFEDRSTQERGHLIHAEAYLKYERQIRNLNIQEARLYRTAEKARLELTRLQALRRRREAAELSPAKQSSKAPAAPWDGFDFSTHSADPTAQPPSPLPGPNVKRQAA